MDNNLKTLTTFGTAFLVLSMFSVVVLADSHSMDSNVTVGNDAPVIDSMALDASSYDPTESGTTTVTLTFNVTDTNGVSDLDDTAVQVEVDNQSTFASAVAKYTNTSCVTLRDINGDTRQYQCRWDMDYWDSALEYSTQVTAGDQAGTVSNDTASGAPTYNYTTLVATDIDATTISFGSVSTGTTDNGATENPSTLSNTGNADLYINTTGADLTSNGYTFAVGNFSVDVNSDASAEQSLTTSSAQIAGASIAQGSDSTNSPTEELYWFADVPVGLNPATYTGTWTLTQYEQ